MKTLTVARICSTACLLALALTAETVRSTSIGEDAGITSGSRTTTPMRPEPATMATSSRPKPVVRLPTTSVPRRARHCIDFTGQDMGDMREPVIVSLAAESGATAWRLSIDEGRARLTGGGGESVLLHDFRTERDFSFLLDLDLSRFDMFIDSSRFITGMPLLDAGSDAPSDLKFRTGQCILECLPGTYG